MEIKLDQFMHDLVWLIKEDYNESLDRVASAKSDAEKALEEGQSLAYHHVLATIANQLFAFGAAEEIYEGVEPEHGQKAEMKKTSF
ncbi:MAG: hypothetical protein ACT4O9_05720 [Blastocatellia bacterium]